MEITLMPPRNAQSFLVETIAYGAKPGAILMVKAPEGHKAPGQVCGFTHACPCGCGRLSFIRLNRDAWAPGTTPIWDHAGDDLHMTLAPSIGIHPLENGVYHWHGFLRDGVFVEC